MSDTTSDPMPSDTPEFMRPAWASCLMWAVSKPEIVEQFRADTGMTWKPSNVPIERMVDEATGIDQKTIAAFVAWFNVNIWGAMSGPDGVEDAVLREAAK